MPSPLCYGHGLFTQVILRTIWVILWNLGVIMVWWTYTNFDHLPFLLIDIGFSLRLDSFVKRNAKMWNISIFLTSPIPWRPLVFMVRSSHFIKGKLGFSFVLNVLHWLLRLGILRPFIASLSNTMLQRGYNITSKPLILHRLKESINCWSALGYTTLIFSM